jgi:hypothetical protein
MRYKDLPEHFRDDFPYLFRRFANVDSAFEPILELSLASSAGMNLRFNDNFNVAKLARDLFRFIKSRGNFAARCCYIEFLQ